MGQTQGNLVGRHPSPCLLPTQILEPTEHGAGSGIGEEHAVVRRFTRMRPSLTVTSPLLGK